MVSQQGERFSDRAEAGRQLAARLAAMNIKQPVVYALPRGGVPVALEVARALGAPLDLIFVRKIGAPGAPEVALGAVVDGASPQTVINEEVRRHSRASNDYLERARAHELQEIERRRARYLGDRPQVDPKGRTVIIVDDGLATGATMKAALIAMKRQGASRICVAVPVAPAEVLAEMKALADDVICLNPVRVFYGVGAFYDDFHQLTDEETVGLLRQIWSATGGPAPDTAILRRAIAVPPLGLPGELAVPQAARGLVLFAHGSGSSRLSPRNRMVADQLNANGFATLLFDLLTANEAADRRNVFDIPLLAERIVEGVVYASGEPDIADLPLGLFGASTGGGAALVAAAELGSRVGAVVSRGGRPDLAGARLAKVKAATLLIVGGDDTHVIELNRQAVAHLRGDKLLRIVPDAGHLFEEPGKLEAVAQLACAWFEHYLPAPRELKPAQAVPVPDKAETLVQALRRLAQPLP
ncbi:phosphoribosyltransferase, partial [Paracoccus benzoatiresistens]